MTAPVDPTLISILSVVGEVLVSEIVGRASSAFRSGPVSAAVTETQLKYPGVIVEEALSAWAQSDAFRTFIQRFVGGERDFGDEDLVDSFIVIGGLSLPNEEELRSTAREVLATFFGELQTHVYSSKGGTLAIAARQEALHERTFAEVRELTKAVDAIATNTAVAPDDEKSRAGQSSVHAQIDGARSLLRQGKPDSARMLLIKIRESLPADASPDVRFRLETNLGVAFTELGEDVEARRHLSTALQIKPANAMALANAAQAELAASKTTRALELARRAWDVEKNAQTATAMILTLRASGRQEDVGPLLQDQAWTQMDATCLAVLAQSSLEDDDVGKAVRLFRESLALDPEQPRVWMQLASGLVRQAQETLREDLPIPWRMQSEQREMLEEAEVLLGRAGAALRSHEPRSTQLDPLAFRASVLLMLSRVEDAIRECDYVLHEDPTHLVAMRTKGVAVTAKDPGLAADLLRNVWDRTKDDPIVGIALANAYGASGRFAEAAQLLRTMRSAGRRDRSQIDVLVSLGDVLTRSGKHEEAKAVEADLLADWPGDPEAVLGVARIRRARGDTEGALDLLRPSLESAPARMATQIALELADLLIESRDFLGASHALDVAVDDSAPLWVRQRYAACMFNAGRFKDALTFAQGQRGDGPPIPGISEVEAEVLLRISDLGGALGILSAMAESDATRADLRLKCAQVAWQQREFEAARQYLRTVSTTELAEDPTGLMILAQLRRELNEPDALEPAYEARRLGFDQPRMHLAYMALFLGREAANDASLEVSEIGIGSTVVLARDTETQVWTIEDNKPDAGRDEIPSGGALAQRLIGRAVGDTVVLKEGGLEDLRYEVKEVRSKYVHAFQDTIQNFSSRFPDERGLDRVQIRDDDITPLLRMLDARSERAQEVLDLYNRRLLPLATVGKLLGVPPIEVARDLRDWSAQTVLVSSGSSEEFEGEQWQAAAEVVVVDPTALVTIDELGLWDVLPKLFKRVLVPQQLLDEIGESLREPIGRQAGTAAKIGDRYVMGDVDQHEVDDRRARLEALLERARRELEVVPASGLLDVGADDATRSVAMLGQGSFAALHVARIEGAVLWSDDLGLRSVAKNDLGVEGTWTQPVLMRGVRASVMTEDRYQSALMNMAEWRFSATWMSGTELAAALGKQAGALTPGTSQAVGFLLGTDFDVAYAVSLATQTVRGVWLQPLLLPRKQLVLDLILSSLVRGRDPREVLSRLRAQVAQSLRLVPQAEVEVLESIDLWAAVRRLPSQS
jgi:tetratricopeptide (TPR) repeat protein